MNVGELAVETTMLYNCMLPTVEARVAAASSSFIRVAGIARSGWKFRTERWFCIVGIIIHKDSKIAR